MKSMNWSKIILGGLVAGLIVNIFEFVVNGVILAEDWAAAMQALGKSAETTPAQMTTYVVWGFLMGLAAVWLYASIRPRYGAGPKTAICVGAAVWWLAYFMAMVPPALMDIMPARLMMIGVVVGLVEILLGTVAGASLYKEESAAPLASSAAGAGS